MDQYIIIVLFIITLYLFYRFLSKNNFNLNGLELIIYELSFIFLFQIGNYSVGINIRQETIGIILFLFLAIYYLLKTLVTQQYTKIWIILIYLLLFFINAYSIETIPTEGWEGLGLAFEYYIVFVFGMGVYILLMNFISFIIKCIKNKKRKILENINPQIKPLYKSISKITILILIIFISISYVKFDEYLYKKIEEPYIEKLTKYLNDKYSGLDFEVHSKYFEGYAECNIFKCYIPYVYFYATNNTLNIKFNVYIDEENIIVDDFIEEYYDEITDYQPDKYFSGLLSNSFKNNNFNVIVEIDVSLIEEKTTDINTILKEEELLQLVEIKDLKVIINDNFNDNESFKKYATKLYKYYESYIGKYNQYKSLEYEFSKPELNDTIFKNGGSIDKLRNEITVYYTDINR